MSEQRINDGGPAFGFASGDMVSLGMTLRDYFAAAALQGLMAKMEPENQLEHHIAKWSYEAADAMLKARESK
jgi:hypothetical protein